MRVRRTPPSEPLPRRAVSAFGAALALEQQLTPCLPPRVVAVTAEEILAATEIAVLDWGADLSVEHLKIGARALPCRAALGPVRDRSRSRDTKLTEHQHIHLRPEEAV